MKKDEQQKPLFEIWLAAYNNRLIRIIQRNPDDAAQVQAKSGEEDSAPEPPSGSNH